MRDSTLLPRPDPFFHWSIQGFSRGKWKTVKEFAGLFEEAIDRMKDLRKMNSTAFYTRVIQRGNPPDPSNRPFNPPE